MGVFAAISSIIVSVLFISFRTSKKSESLVVLKQNGNAAMSQMVNSIRYAQSLDDPISCVTPVTQSEITITSAFDGGQTTFSCPNNTSDAIASNGAALLDTGVVEISTCSFVCSQTTLNDPPTITIQYYLDMIDTTTANDKRAGISFQTAVTLRNYSR